MIPNKNSKNSIWLASQYLIIMASSFICLKLNLMSFGPQKFGIWILFNSLWTFGGIMDFGLNVALVKYISQSKNQWKTINEIINSYALLFILFGILIFSIIFPLSDQIYVEKFKNSVETNSSELIRLSFLLGINFYLNYFSIFIKSIFEGLNNFRLSSLLSIINSLFVLASSALVLLTQKSLIELSIYLTISTFFQLCFSVFLALKHFPFLKFGPIFFKAEWIKKTFSYSMSIQITFLLGALVDPVLKYIIGSFGQLQSVSHYEIARKFAISFSGLFTFSLKNLLPKISQLNNLNSQLMFLAQKGAQLSRISLLFSLVNFIFLPIIFILLAKYFYQSTESIVIFYILIAIESINCFSYSVYVFLITIKETIFLSTLQFLNLILASTLTFLFSLLFQNNLGLCGFYLSVLIGALSMLLFLNKRYHVNSLQFILDSNALYLVFANILITIQLLIIINYEYYLSIQILFSVVILLLFRKKLITYSCETKTLIYAAK